MRKDVLGLVKYEQRSASAREHPLGESAGAEARRSVDAIAVAVRVVHLVDARVQACRNGTGKLGLPRAWVAVEEDVDAMGARAQRSPENACHQLHALARVREVLER